MMSDTDLDPIGYAAAAGAYWEAGWRGILPLYHMHKGGENSGLPVGYTGHAGVDTSWPDIMTWSDDDRYRGGNLALRLPNNDQIAVVGIDVDHYGAKAGAHTLAEAERRWGKLPAGPRSTSRVDGTSGIRLFRVPPGTMLKTMIEFRELAIGDIEICQRHHRYVISWPSIHPEGRRYQWIDNESRPIDIPNPQELPWLPQEWIDGLKVEPKSHLPTDASYNVARTLTAGDPSARVQERVRQAIKELNMPGTSRHDTVLRHVMALMRMGQSGEPGVKTSLQLLCDVFIAAVSADGSRSPDAARGEFLRMITNDNAARELSRPSLTDWFDALIVDDSAPDGERGDDPPNDADPSEEGSTADANTDHRTKNSTGPHSHLQEIERGFWDSRESLRMIWQTSMAMMASPWATLGVTAARALTTVRPNATLPALISGPGSLNLFVALVARSGGGKGAATGAARLLVPDDLVQTRLLGSGEGLVALFGRAADENDPTPVFESLLIDVQEVDTLTAMGNRSASTTMAVLRSAFMGEALGFAYADKSKRRHILAHTYRMTMIVGVQPKQSAPLLGDEGGGTPQRFMWFPAKDNRISMEEHWPSGPLTLPEPSEWLYPREIQIPKEAAYTIRLERVKSQRDEQDALDGHALFCREKFAYALAVIDGRVNMTLEDWELSGIAADVSLYTRELCAEELRQASRIEALDRGELRGIEMHAADAAKEYEEAEKVRRVLRRALAKIEEAGESGLLDGELTRAIAYRDRRWLAGALAIGRSNGLIRQREGTSVWERIV